MLDIDIYYFTWQMYGSIYPAQFSRTGLRFRWFITLFCFMYVHVCVCMYVYKLGLHFTECIMDQSRS